MKLPGLLNALDEQVFDYAGQNAFTLVSQDRDFRDLSALRGPPPQVVWLRVRNAKTAAIAALLRKHAGVLRQFASAPTKSLLIVGNFELLDS